MRGSLISSRGRYSRSRPSSGRTISFPKAPASPARRSTSTTRSTCARRTTRSSRPSSRPSRPRRPTRRTTRPPRRTPGRSPSPPAAEDAAKADAELSFEGTFDHGEEGYGLWLDPAVEDNAVYAEHWAGHRPVEVSIEEAQIVIRAAGAGGDE